MALKQLSDLASSLPQDACLTVNDTVSKNETSEMISDDENINDYPKKVFLFFLLYFVFSYL